MLNLALGIQRDETKDVLSLMNELKHQGLKNILVEVIEGLKGPS